jgi:hypothetical protein
MTDTRTDQDREVAAVLVRGRLDAPSPWGRSGDLVDAIAAALAAARQEERDLCIEDVQEHSCRTYSELCDCQSYIIEAIRARGGAQ